MMCLIRVKVLPSGMNWIDESEPTHGAQVTVHMRRCTKHLCQKMFDSEANYSNDKLV